MLLDLARLFLFPALMAFAASSDLFTMTISNRVSMLLIAGFFVMAVLTGMPLAAIAMHLGAGIAVLAIAFFLFAMGWIGGGDAKVAAAAALWFGFDHLLPYLTCASLFGGILTFAILGFRRLPLPYMLGSQSWLLRLHHNETGIPYGIALALGALMIYPETGWITAIDYTRFAIP